MPFAGYESFDACVADQESKGHDSNSAHQVCGYLYNKLEKANTSITKAVNILADLEKAKWSRSYINDLPDSAFLVIDSGGSKDGDGKTTPRSLRHFPVRDDSGKLDLPHLRNALSRIPQSKLPQNVKDKAKAKAQRLLEQSTEKAAGDAIDKARRMVKPKPMYKEDLGTSDLKAGGMQVGNQTSKKKPKEPKTIVNGIQQTGSQNLSIIVASRKSEDPPTSGQSDVSFNIALLAKTDSPGEEQYVLGVVLEPEVEDAQHDIYDEQTIRKTAHDFMANYQEIGLQHEGSVDDRVKILESYIAPCDFEMNGQTIKKGTWMLGARVVDDALWQDVKSGALTGWSIGGSAIRTPVDNTSTAT